MTQTTTLLSQDVAQALLARLDFGAQPLAGRHEPGPCPSISALSVAGLIRHTPVCHVGYTAPFVESLLRNATESQISSARELADRSLVWGSNITQHFGLQQDDAALLVGSDEQTWDRLAAEFESHFEDWPHVHWGTSQTLCRLLQLAWHHPRCSDAAFAVFLSALAVRVEKEWEWARSWDDAMLGTRGHNWWICQFLGLFKSAVLFPSIRASRPMRGLSENFLARQLRLLFDADGYTRERSIRYHLITVGVVMDWIMFAQLNGIALPKEATRLISAFGELEAALITPDDQFPWFGDVGPLRRAGEASSRLRGWAGLLGEGSFHTRAEAVSGPDRAPVMASRITLCTVGMDLSPGLDALEMKGPGALDHAMFDAGLYVMRSQWSRRADYMAIDGSSRGDVVSSHGHDGLFHFVLHARGEPMIVDSEAGWQYDPSPAYDRESAQAHNVATVDGKGHLGLRRIFRFEQQVTPVVEDWRSQPGMCYLSTVHEAYAGIGVTGARRKFFYRRGRYWLLLDRFTPDRRDEEHIYRQHLHLQNEPTAFGPRGLVSVAGSGAGLIVLPVFASMERQPVTACAWPVRECRNPWATGYTLKTRGHGMMGLLMVPFDGRPPTVQVEPVDVEADGRLLAEHEATGLAITIDGQTDTHVDLHMAWDLPWRANGLTGAGRLFNSGVVDSVES